MSVSIMDLVDKSVPVQVPSVNSVERVLETFNFSSYARSLHFLSIAVDAAATTQLTLKDPFFYTTNPFTIQAINSLLGNSTLP